MFTMPRARYEIPALRKALQVIELLCDADRAMGVSDIAKELDINKMTAFRILQTLHDAGWVVKDNGEPTYRIGLLAFHHTSKAVRKRSLLQEAEGPLEALWKETGAYTFLCVLDDTRLVTVQAFEPWRGDIKISGRVGGRYLLHCSAPGKVLLAYADDGLLKRLNDEGFERRTRHTICKLPALKKELATARRQGYAVDLEEYTDGAMCFAAPVFGHTGQLVAAVSITVITLYYTPEKLLRELGPKVIATARRISAALGCSELGRVKGEGCHP